MTHTEGDCGDAVIDALSAQSPPVAMMDGFRALRVGGRGADPGGVSAALTLDASFLRDYNAQLMGSRWFTTAEGDDLAAMAAAGPRALPPLHPRPLPPAQGNHPIAPLC